VEWTRDGPSCLHFSALGPAPLTANVGHHTRMEIHNTKLVIYSTLVALGVILMLLGISWLLFLGMALMMLSAHFSSRKVGGAGLAAFLVCAASAVTFLFVDMHRGAVMTTQPRPLWLWIIVIGSGVWAILDQLWIWRKCRSLP
jgi:hypothetical protein